MIVKIQRPIYAANTPLSEAPCLVYTADQSFVIHDFRPETLNLFDQDQYRLYYHATLSPDETELTYHRPATQAEWNNTCN